MSNLLQFPNRFLNDSLRREFELKNSLIERPIRNNHEFKILRAKRWSINFDRKMRILMEIK